MKPKQLLEMIDNELMSQQSKPNSISNETKPKITIDWAARGIPRRYASAKITDLQLNTLNNRMIEVATEQLGDISHHRYPEKGMFIYGLAGNGKTHAIMTIARALIWENELKKRENDERLEEWERTGCNTKRPSNEGKSIYIIKFSELLKWVADSWTNHDDPISEIASYDIVILDDITAQSATVNSHSPYQWAKDSALRLLDLLWDNCGLLYATSNNTREELITNFSPQFYDRIKGLCHIVENNDASHR
jgi:DNA replication protein DnaC